MSDQSKDIEKITHEVITGIGEDLRAEGHELFMPFNPPMMKIVVRNIVKVMLEKECKHELSHKSKWNSTFGKYVGMCTKCGILIAKD